MDMPMETKKTTEVTNKQQNAIQDGDDSDYGVEQTQGRNSTLIFSDPDKATRTVPKKKPEESPFSTTSTTGD